jgi:hypothetical protein
VVENMKIDLREAGWGSVDWIGLPQDVNLLWAFVNAVMNFLVS